MELKTYQKNVIGDLSRFLALLTEKEMLQKHIARYGKKRMSTSV